MVVVNNNIEEHKKEVSEKTFDIVSKLREYNDKIQNITNIKTVNNNYFRD